MRILVAGYPEHTKNYCLALARAGLEPVVCLDVTSPLPGSCDGLLLPGGGDIDPLFFGEKNLASRNIDRNLDLIQFSFLETFAAARKPILGICKGMQLIHVHFGGRIIQDLPTASVHCFQETDQYHTVTAQGTSFLTPLYGERFLVNSAHHQGLGTPGKQLRITLSADDLVPEAIEHDTLPILGLQFHPERLCGDKLPCGAVSGDPVFSFFQHCC